MADTKNSNYPEELSDENLEYIYIGVIMNNPKALSVYYFLADEFYFSDEELGELYKSILFQEAEKFAPAIAKENFNIPRERPNTYARKQEIKKIEQNKSWDNSIPAISRSDIIKTIEQYLRLHIKQGHFRQRAYGIYKVNRDVIRTKELKDIDTILHEMGHALDMGRQIKYK